MSKRRIRRDILLQMDQETLGKLTQNYDYPPPLYGQKKQGQPPAPAVLRLYGYLQYLRTKEEPEALHDIATQFNDLKIPGPGPSGLWDHRKVQAHVGRATSLKVAALALNLHDLLELAKELRTTQW